MRGDAARARPPVHEQDRGAGVTDERAAEPIEHFDVLIVGAGISGVGGAYHLTQQCPGTSFVVLEAQATFGGGLAVIFAGLPLHFDGSWPTDLDSVGSSRFAVWLGYDF